MKKSEIKKLDKQWSLRIRNNFNNKCVICSKAGNNPHHYYGRRNRATRWYLPNGICLCAGCHTFNSRSAHQAPEHFRTDILELWGDKWLKDLGKQSLKVCKSDYETVKKYLDDELNNYC